MTADQLSTTFAALADPTRRAVLARLASGEVTVTELGRAFQDESACSVEAPESFGAGGADCARARRAVAALQAGSGAAEGRCGLGWGIPAVLGGEFRSTG